MPQLTDRQFVRAEHPLYAHAAVRVEHRPSAGHPVWTREELSRTLDRLAEAGVDAWWFSVAVPPAQLLFESRHFPAGSHRMPVEDFQWLTEQAHEHGISVLSHYPFNAAPLLLAEQPDWSMHFVGRDGPVSGNGRTPCFASPYFERLIGLSHEIVNDLGFDGIWFDCTSMAEYGQLGCVCPRCRKLFQERHGHEAPQRIDFDSEAFRLWFRWRQQWFMELWHRFAEAFHSNARDKTLVLKSSSRLNHTGETAVPLDHFPPNVVAAVEVDWRPNQVLMQMKYLRAATPDAQPPESWLGGSDGTSVYQPARPDPDPAGMIIFGAACATGGGHASFSARADAQGMIGGYAKAIRPVAPFIGGAPLRFAGLLVSNSTLDFAHRVGSDQHSRWQPELWRGAFPAWHAIHGTHYLLNALHLPSEVVFESDLNEASLGDYPLLVLPDVQCLSDEQAFELRRYVEAGGILLALGDTATRDPWGVPRMAGAIDELLGVRQRSDHASHLIYDDPDTSLRGADLPIRYMISGKGRVVEVADDVRVLARAEVIHSRFRRTPTGDLPQGPPAVTEGVAVWERQVGRGVVIGVANNVGVDYAINNNRRTRLVIDALIRRHLQPPFEVDAPPNVAVTAWRQGDDVVFHILNQPQSMCHLDEHNMPFHPEDIPPTGPIRITWPQHRVAVTSIHGNDIQVNRTDRKTIITLPRLALHDVLRASREAVSQ